MAKKQDVSKGRDRDREDRSQNTESFEVRYQGVWVEFDDELLLPASIGLQGGGVRYEIAGQPVHDDRKSVLDAVKAVLDPAKFIAEKKRECDNACAEAQSQIDQTRSYLNKMNMTEGPVFENLQAIITENQDKIDAIKAEYLASVEGSVCRRDEAMGPFLDAVHEAASLVVTKLSGFQVLIKLGASRLQGSLEPNRSLRIDTFDIDEVAAKVAINLPANIGPTIRADRPTTIDNRVDSKGYSRMFFAGRRATVWSIAGDVENLDIEQNFMLTWGFARPVMQVQVRADGNAMQWLVANGNVTPVIIVSSEKAAHEPELGALGEALVEAMKPKKGVDTSAEQVEINVPKGAETNNQGESAEA